MQFHFADFNGWQTAYAFDVDRLGVEAAADTADSRKAFLTSFAEGLGHMAELEELTADLPVDRTQLTSAREGLERFKAVDTQIIQLFRKGDAASNAQADQLVMGEAIKVFGEASTALNAVTEQLTAMQADAEKQAAASGRTAQWTNLGLGVGLLAIMILGSLAISRSIAKPLAELGDGHRAARGRRPGLRARHGLRRRAGPGAEVARRDEDRAHHPDRGYESHVGRA